MLPVTRASLSIVILAIGILAANLISSHVHPFRTFYNELAIVWALLLASVASFSQSTWSLKVVTPRVIYGLLALLMMLVMQLLMRQVEVHQIIYPSMFLVLGVLAIFLGARFGEAPLQGQALCTGVAIAHLVAALVSAGMETIQILGWDWRPFVMYIPTQGVSGIRPFANIAQPNQLALLLCFGLASIWWLRQQRKLHGVVALLFSVLLIWGLALTQSRIAWIILPLFGLMAGSGFVGRQRESIIAISGLIVLYALLVFNLPHISNWIGFSSGSVIERIGGRSERTILAQQALAMIVSHPWAGVGWFGFGPAQVDIGGQFTPTIYAEHSHNLVLNFAAELGVPFALLFFGALAIWLWRSFSKREMRDLPEIGFFLLFFVAVGVHSMVEFPLWYAFVMIPLFVLAGLAHRMAWQTEPANLSASLMQRGAILGLLFSAFVVFDYHRVVDGFAEFRKTSDYQKMDARKIRRPDFTLMPDYYAYFIVMRMTPQTGMSEDEILFLRDTSRRFGYVHILSKLAEVYVLNGRPEQAIVTMRTLSRIHPFYYPEYYDYWQQLAKQDVRYVEVFNSMPKRDFMNN